jgi:hypothetical protein
VTVTATPSSPGTVSPSGSATATGPASPPASPSASGGR